MTVAPSEPIKITSPTLHATTCFTISVFVTIIFMVCILKVEVVARGKGKVVPVSRVQVVQPEFDGKITAIHVRNGSKVRQGEVLIELDTTDAEAEFNTIAGEMERLQMERKRIITLASGIKRGDIQAETFYGEVLRAFEQGADTENDFYDEQARLLFAEVEDLQAAISHMAAKIKENDSSSSVTQANIARIEAAIAYKAERLEVARKLMDRDAISRSAFLDVQESFTALEKEREMNLRELNQKISQKAVLKAEQRSIITAQRNQLLQRRTELEARLATLAEQLRSAERRVVAAQLTAPMNGVVDQLKVFTIGAVARAGEQVLRVVPEDQNVEIEAIFTNNDIGFVEIGQQANINLDAYPSARFGFVAGVVSDVAADSTKVTEGVWVFEVRITPEESKLTNGTEQYAIRPGMTATIDITTDKRRLISYFFAPIIDTITSALGER